MIMKYNKRIGLAIDIIFSDLDDETYEIIQGLVSGDLRLNFMSNFTPRSMTELADLDPEYAQYLFTHEME